MKKRLIKRLFMIFLMLVFTFFLSSCKIELPKQPIDDFNSDSEFSISSEDNSTFNSNVLFQEESQKSAPSTDASTASSPNHQSDVYIQSVPNTTNSPDLQSDNENSLTCSLSVECTSIFENIDKFNKDKLSILPKDGIIYKENKVIFNDGDSAFDVLKKEMRKNRIHMEFVNTPIYNSNYIKGIANIYEKDCGDLSGWIYKVNGVVPNYGVSKYKLVNGDKIELEYTCDLGKDVQ